MVCPLLGITKEDKKDFNDKLDKEGDRLDIDKSWKQAADSNQNLKLTELRIELHADIKTLANSLPPISYEPIIILLMIHQEVNRIKLPIGNIWEQLAKLSPAQRTPESSVRWWLSGQWV